MIDNFCGISAAHFLAWKLHVCACTRRGIRKALLRPVRLDYRQEISLSMFYLSNGLLVLQVSITQVRFEISDYCELIWKGSKINISVSNL